MNPYLEIFIQLCMILLVVSFIVIGPSFFYEFYFNLQKDELGIPFSFAESKTCSTIVKNLVELENVFALPAFPDEPSIEQYIRVYPKKDYSLIEVRGDWFCLKEITGSFYK